MGIPVFAPRFETDQMRPFYEGLAKGELWMTACSECGKWYWYPPEVSPCHPDAHIEWRPVSPVGEVYTFTTIHRSLLPGDHKADAPYTIVMVESETVPGARIPSLLVNSEGREPACGMRVRLSPVQAGDWTLAAFEPFDGPSLETAAG